ncbi:GMC family oxidoreductase [Rhizorhabdus dicambivorans]|nr:GMC family oxidoreductase N-terminal domain-containing protein [Rhizorhabdus dicambivorans]
MFDHVIVGGGTAAGVMAWRLIEAGRSVCVLEAGPPDRRFYHRLPVGFSQMLFDDRTTWQYASEPNPATAGRAIHIPQGRTLGGSSSVNGMAYVRGQPADFDRWAELGNRGWSYADVLPLFRRSERYLGEGDDGYRGRAGRVSINTRLWQDATTDALVEAAMIRGHPFNQDYNGKEQRGVGYFQSMIHRGRRVSTATAFLHPARRRGADVRTGALAHRLIIAEGRVTGVDYLSGGTRRRVSARHSVIVAAGPVGSPKLLQLSGIGPGEVLRHAGAPLRHELPGVGENLHDHYGPRLVARLKPGAASINARVTGLGLAGQTLRWLIGKPNALSIGAALIHVYGSSEPGSDRPDYSLHFAPLSYHVESGTAPGSRPVVKIDDRPGLTCGAWQMRPLSRGHVRIRSLDPHEQPVIDPRYLAEETDRRVIVAAMKEARAIFATPPLAQLVDHNLIPGDDVRSDEEWLDFVRQTGGTGFHLIGACRMGPRSDPLAVVDERLRVHGLEGLYVADSSIMPEMVSANTVAATMMIGEKASDLIVQDSRG